LFEERFEKLLKSNFENEFELALFSTIIHRKLSIQYFFDLLSAFKQDVIKKNYETFNELLDYCNRSANPIGRLILELLEIRVQKAYELSDKICTALQLTNFYQDVLIDFEKERIYIPQQELKNFGVDEKYFQEKIFDENIKNLIKFQIDRTENLFNEGKELLNYLQGRMKYEIDWTINGGLFILQKIKLNNYNIFEQRPKINKKEFIKFLFK
jgi:squalene synthase HpnC